MTAKSTAEKGFEIKEPSEDDFEEIYALDERSFHMASSSPAAKALTRQEIELDRFRIAVANGRIVGVAGARSLDLTLPGLALLPTAGVTWVSVEVTHRRQGILRALMAEMDQMAASRGEPAMALGASEATIYGRFGYGICNQLRFVEIGGSAEFKPEFRSAPGTVTIHKATDVLDTLASLWDQYQRMTPGEVSVPVQALRKVVGRSDKPMFAALHPDGFALWSVNDKWRHGQQLNTLVVETVAAAEQTAQMALWETLLSVDLIARVTSSRAVSDDDLLASWLTNPRDVQTVAMRDNLWVKVTDVERCFSAREYRTKDNFVLRTQQGTFDVDNDECSPSCSEPDLIVEPQAVGPLLLGGVSATWLSGAGLLNATDSSVLGRADAFFGWSPSPTTRWEF